MRGTAGISEQGGQTIQDFIEALITHKDLNPKTLKEYASDMKHFIGWFQIAGHQKEEVVFRMDRLSPGVVCTNLLMSVPTHWL